MSKALASQSSRTPCRDHFEATHGVSSGLRDRKSYSGLSLAISCAGHPLSKNVYRIDCSIRLVSSEEFGYGPSQSTPNSKQADRRRSERSQRGRNVGVPNIAEP